MTNVKQWLWYDEEDDSVEDLKAHYCGKSCACEKRIGIAQNINFPSDFDDIDYGTKDLFGLKETRSNQ